MAENVFKLARIKYNQHGLQSVETVSKETGISASMINDLESNVGKKRGASYLKVAQLAKYYGVSSDYLLGLTDIRSTNPDIKFLSEMTGLSEQCIENLKIIHDTDTKARPDGKVKYETVETINCLVESLSSKSNALVWIGRYLSVPQISNDGYYVSPSGDIKQRGVDVAHENDEFLQIDRCVIEGALLQQVTAELVILKAILNSDEFQGDLEKWKEENK